MCSYEVGMGLRSEDVLLAARVSVVPSPGWILSYTQYLLHISFQLLGGFWEAVGSTG